jgi:hypothetical protein
VNSSQPNPDLDRRPLTVSHGKKLYDQSKAISAQLKELTPLLGLLDEAEQDQDQDPIAHILRLLETLADQGQRQTELLQEIDAKLEFLLGNTNTSER